MDMYSREPQVGRALEDKIPMDGKRKSKVAEHEVQVRSEELGLSYRVQNSWGSAVAMTAGT